MMGVLQSRKFWFSFAVPIAISTLAFVIHVIDGPQYIAAITATSGVYGATVAYEDAHA